MGERLRGGQSSQPAVHSFAVTDQQPLRLVRGEHLRRRQPEEHVDADAVVIAANVKAFVPRASATTSVFVSCHQSAVSPIASFASPRHTRTGCQGGRPERRCGGWRVERQSSRSHGCGGRGAGARPWAFRACVPARSRRASRQGRRARTFPSEARACEVRVIGSSTIHEKPSAPKSSQKRSSIRTSFRMIARREADAGESSPVARRMRDDVRQGRRECQYS